MRNLGSSIILNWQSRFRTISKQVKVKLLQDKNWEKKIEWSSKRDQVDSRDEVGCWHVVGKISPRKKLFCQGQSNICWVTTRTMYYDGRTYHSAKGQGFHLERPTRRLFMTEGHCSFFKMTGSDKLCYTRTQGNIASCACGKFRWKLAKQAEMRLMSQ